MGPAGRGGAGESSDRAARGCPDGRYITGVRPSGSTLTACASVAIGGLVTFHHTVVMFSHTRPTEPAGEASEEIVGEPAAAAERSGGRSE